MSADTEAMEAKELADLRSAKIALPIEQRRHAAARRRIHELERALQECAKVCDAYALGTYEHTCHVEFKEAAARIRALAARKETPNE